MPKQVRAWVGTCNNYTLEEYSKLWRLVNNVSEESIFRNTDGEPIGVTLVSFASFQIEKGETGTPHIQLYIEFSTKRTRGGVLGMLNVDRTQWSVRKARAGDSENIIYTNKGRDRGGHAVECDGYCGYLGLPCHGIVGRPMQQGARSDLVAIKKRIDAGCTEDDILQDYFGQWVRYRGAFREAIDRRRARSVPRDRGNIRVTVLWGETGTGKSRWCYDNCPDAFWLRQPQGGVVWWDGYEYEETVVIDEFYGWLPFNFVLRLLDRYSFSLPVKYGHRVCNVRHVVFTSNTPPDEWWPDARIPDEKRKAFRRRISETRHFVAAKSG
jgi:hypothetical protein